MKADTRTLQQVFHGDRQFVVPVYQRPYVWERERQWEPLWDDVESTAQRMLEARTAGFIKGDPEAKADESTAPHFLGAVVLEQILVPMGNVETRLVVDGQQRLTTLQLLLRGVLDALDDADAPTTLRAKVRKALRNDQEVVGPAELRKLTPRLAEVGAFETAIDDESPDPENSSFAAARTFFRESAAEFLADDHLVDDPYLAADGRSSTEQRATLLVATLLELVKLVVIDLESVDDAQVIFEALNARNTPLSATDLVKNLLFLRAQAEHLDTQLVYDTLWKRFDDDSEWWLESTGVGHAQRARQDWLLGDWLIAELTRTINVGRLYGEFRQWLDTTGNKALDALRTLNRFADAYEALNARRPGASLRELQAYRTIERLNITAATPVLLWLLVQPEHALDAQRRELALRALESFVVRRMAAKYQTRGYGQTFVDVLKLAGATSGDPATAVIEALRSGPNGYEWPSTDDLVVAFTDGRYYGPGGINQDRLRLILGAVDAKLQDEATKAEKPQFNYENLQIEHVIPQGWREHWPVLVEDPAARLVAESERERHINRIGNLTLATGPLNVSMSNNPWQAKKEALLEHSKLELNSLLIRNYEQWDEAAIVERGKWLAQQLDAIWPGPDSAEW